MFRLSIDIDYSVQSSLHCNVICENWNFFKRQMKEYNTVENLCLEMNVLETMAQCVRGKKLF